MSGADWRSLVRSPSMKCNRAAAHPAGEWNGQRSPADAVFEPESPEFQLLLRIHGCLETMARRDDSEEMRILRMSLVYAEASGNLAQIQVSESTPFLNVSTCSTSSLHATAICVSTVMRESEYGMSQWKASETACTARECAARECAAGACHSAGVSFVASINTNGADSPPRIRRQLWSYWAPLKPDPVTPASASEQQGSRLLASNFVRKGFSRSSKVSILDIEGPC